MRALNRVELIGNATRDAELHQTNSGTDVCSFTVATNRSWTKADGVKQEETEYHRVVAWGKLAQICSQFIRKASKVYIEGRLQTRKYEKDGVEQSTTEIIAGDMILLDRRAAGPEDGSGE
jgi:single-strand DNA-binding protein